MPCRAVLLLDGSPGTLDKQRLEPRGALAQPRRFALPALSFWPGDRPAQETRCPSLANRLMSVPVSARIEVAAKLAMPEMVSKSAVQIAKGAAASGRLLVYPGDCRVHLTIDLRDGRGQSVVLTEVKPQHEPVMIGQPAVQRIVERFGRGLDLPGSSAPRKNRPLCRRRR